MKQKLLKTMRGLLVAAGLCVGVSAWADPYDVTWDFTVQSYWFDKGISLSDNTKQYDNTGNEVGSGGVSFNFSGTNSQLRTVFKISSTVKLWIGDAGNATTNNISMTVPSGYEISLVTEGVSSGRKIGYTIDGGSSTSEYTSNDFSYRNETGGPVTFTFWFDNPWKDKQAVGQQNKLNSIRLRDVSSVATHGYSVTAKCGETTIDTWSGTEIEEGATYYVPAKAYIYANSKYYVLDDAKYTAPNFGYQQTMGTADAAFEIAYTEYTAGDIVYFAEAEKLNSGAMYSTNNASGGKRSHANGSGRLSIGNLPAGIYTFDLGTNDNRAVYFRDNGNSDNNSNTLTYVNAGTATGTFVLTAETPVVITGYTTGSGGLNQSGDFDYVLIKKVSDATSVLSANEAQRLTFKNATSGSSAWENWMLAVYSGTTKVVQVRADWWEDVAASNAGFTYGYTYSSDGGTTADNTNWGSTFMSDMTDASVDLTLSYSGGSLYVIGTMTKGDKVYYVNYTKSGLTGTLAYNLYGNNATISELATAAASVLTTPAHPTNVVVAMGTNGFATYANNVYPLDLTSAPAYKAAIADDKVNFTLFEQAVPAGTGMLVEGSGTVNLPIADASTSVDGNAFKVNTSDAVFTAEANTTYYGMMKDMSPLTFGTFDPSAVAIPANKAYLAVSGASASRLTAVFGKATGINAIDSAKVANCYYNLNGQRVSKPANGLYIVNGKKVIIK